MIRHNSLIESHPSFKAANFNQPLNYAVSLYIEK